MTSSDMAHRSLPECSTSLLKVLVGVVQHQPQAFAAIGQQYYTFLSQLLTSGSPGQLDQNGFLQALQIPLSPGISPEGDCRLRIEHMKR